MRPAAALFALCAILTNAHAAPSDDMKQLQTACLNAIDVLNASLNGTMTMDTSDILQNITYEIGASTANLNGINSSSATRNLTTNGTSTLDAVYLDYADSLTTLSEAVIRRGRIFHEEPNLPVYDVLQSLATAVHAYGQKLAAAHLISTSSTIRTITAGSDIVQAESAWSNNLNYPGKEKRKA